VLIELQLVVTRCWPTRCLDGQNADLARLPLVLILALKVAEPIGVAMQRNGGVFRLNPLAVNY
jgi:hypothetical protein